MKRTSDTRLMTEGSILRHLILFSIPLLIGNVFQLLYNTVDSLVVGNFIGKEAFAAVNATTPIINTLVGLFTGFATGASVVISQYFGARDRKNLHDTVHTTILTTLIMSVVLTIAGIWAAPKLLVMMKTPDDVFAHAQEYLTIYFAGLGGLMIYNMGAGILRAVGDSRRPLYFLLLSSILNTVLDLLFVLKFNMGVAGVAYATIIAQFVSGGLILAILIRSHTDYRLIPRHLRITKPILKRIVVIGFPAAIQMGITAFSNIFVQSYINAFGSSCMAGWGAYLKVDQFVLLPMQSVAISATTFVGQNLGAQKLTRAHQGTRIALLLSLGVTVVLSIPMLVFARPLIGIFNSDEMALHYGVQTIYWLGSFLVVNCVNQVLAGVLRGRGDGTGPMIIMLGSFVVFRQIYLFIVSRITTEFAPIAFSYPAGWIVCSVMMVAYYRHVRTKRPLQQQ